MPEKEATERAKEDLREGKSPSTAAGELVREEIDHVREGEAWCTVAAAGDCDRLEGAAPVSRFSRPPEGKTGKETRSKAEHDYGEAPDRIACECIG